MRILCLLALFAAAVWGKVYHHPSGFRFDLPAGWTVENGPNAAVLLPPGVKLDANREDNPEVYTVYASEQEDIVEALKENLANSGMKMEGAAAPEALKLSGKVGTVQTFDFVHPVRKAAMRVQIYALTVKGKKITLVVMGLRERVVSRDKELRAVAASLDYDK